MVDARTDTLGALLCGELAAVETYQLAIKLAGGPGTAELRQILTDHREAALDLRQHIQLAGGAAGDSSGVWGAYAEAVEGGDLIGKRHRLRSAEARRSAPLQLLPPTQAHLSMLDGLVQGLAPGQT